VNALERLRVRIHDLRVAAHRADEGQRRALLDEASDLSDQLARMVASAGECR